MRKLLKILFGLLGTLIVLLLAAVIAIPLLVDPNDFRETIAKAVEEHTGRTMRIEGDLELSIFPWLGINTGKLELGNRKGFGESPFARIDSSQIRVKLIPLLSSQLEMDTLILKGLELNLLTRKNGDNNWSDLAAQTKADESSTDSDAPKLASLAIGGIQLENAKILYDDKQTGQRFSITDLNVNTGALQPGAPVALSLSGKLDSSAPAIKGSITLEGILQSDLSTGSFALRDNSLEVNLTGKDLPNGKLAGKLRGTIKVNLNKQTLDINGFRLTSGPIDASGDLSISNLFGNNPGISGKLQLAEFNPRKLLKMLGQQAPVTSDPDVLTRASLDTQLAGSLQKPKLTKLRLVLDDSVLSGSFTVNSLKRPSFSYKLTVDRINLDRYIPPQQNKQAQGFALFRQAHAAARPQPLIPIKLLRSFDMSGSVNAGKVTVNQLLGENARVSISLKSGKLKLSPISADIYGGKYKGNIIIDASRKQGNKPLLSVNESLTNVQLGSILKAMTGEDLFSGIANVSAKLTARGEFLAALQASVNGNIKISMKDGIVKGIDVTQMIRETYAQYKRQPVPRDEDGKNQTNFNSLNVSLQATNGILRSQDLVMVSDLPLVRGVGTINLVNNRIDYTVKTSIDKKLTSMLGLKDKYAGIPIRVYLKGNLLKPTYSVDWQKAIGRIIEKKYKKKAKQKLLESIFGKKKKKQPAPAPTQQQPVPKQNQPAAKPKTPEEIHREKKRRKKEEKRKRKEDLIKGIFGF